MKKSVKTMLRELKKKYQYVNIERILELPFGTLEKWENGKRIPADGVAVLKILYHFPFILHVADANYDEKASKSIFLHSAIDVLLKTEDKLVKKKS